MHCCLMANLLSTRSAPNLYSCVWYVLVVNMCIPLFKAYSKMVTKFKMNFDLGIYICKYVHTEMIVCHFYMKNVTVFLWQRRSGAIFNCLQIVTTQVNVCSKIALFLTSLLDYGNSKI